MRLLGDLCSQAIRVVDYGFGDADYKRLYGTGCRDEATLYLCAPTARGRWARLMHGLCGTASRFSARSGSAGFIRKHWRARLIRR